MNLDRISGICLSISTDWRDIQIIYKNKRWRDVSLIVPLIIVGSNGVYVFLEKLYQKDVKEIYQQLENLLNIRNDGLYLFFFSDDNNVKEDEACQGLAYDQIHHEFYELDDIYDAFDIFYYNHYIPQSEIHYYNFNSFEDYFKLQEVEIEKESEDEEDVAKYVKPVLSSSKVEFVEKKLEELLSAGKKEGKYTYYNDGSITVNKIVRSPDAWKKPWESYTETRTYDYPCSDEDGNKTFLITTFGGWFGLHKFREGKFIQGLFYLLSCGCCCIFYFIDMFAVMTGNYTITNNHYFRSKSGRVEKSQTVIYNRPVKNKKLFLLAPIMAICSFLLLKFAYVPAYEYGSKAISTIIQSTYIDKLSDDKIHEISENEFEQYREFLEDLEMLPVESIEK